MRFITLSWGGGWRANAFQSTPPPKNLMEETDTSQPFVLGLCGIHSSFHVRHGLFDRSEGISGGTDVLHLPRGGGGLGQALRFPAQWAFPLLPFYLTGRLKRADIYPASLVASSV